MSYRVEFIQVGRDKASWGFECVAPPSDDVLLEEVLRKRVLLSRDVNVLTNKDLVSATVFAGMRSVGRIEWREK